MTTLTAQPDEQRAQAAAEPEREPAPKRHAWNDGPVYVAVALLVAAAWGISRLGLMKPGDDLSYRIAVAGGLMMLLLLAYPLRKYSRVMQRLGKLKWWFWGHMLLGIGGPWLILVHSGFHTGSLNAAVALYSMLVVVASGIVGRFIYVRVHRGLDGERTSLHELRLRAGLVETEARSWLHFAPDVEERLRAFEVRETRAKGTWPTYLRQALLLPLERRLVYRQCMREVEAVLRATAAGGEVAPDDIERRRQRARKLVSRHLNAVVRVAQFTAYARLFALWHVAHLPFVYILAISAVVHVVAVHAY